MLAVHFGQFVPEGGSGEVEAEDGDDTERDVDADPALFGPVDVLQVQEEGEFVGDERRSGAIGRLDAKGPWPVFSVRFTPAGPRGADASSLIPPALDQLHEHPGVISEEVPGLLGRLAEVPDPCDPRRVRHRLAVVLALTACAVLAGATSLLVVGEWIADAPAHALEQAGAHPDPHRTAGSALATSASCTRTGTSNCATSART
ncbi:transposase family protein [Streptomyces sp. NPDC058092]|uniref:transposase family protein n=1 Tax=Streptomyces sp. NPDC058092 TaxID=3346336 RepID=UPI0036E34748